VICGPTAIGKTKVAIDIAKHFNTEIISADARQFYREMNIGTAKANEKELAAVPHHFVNNLSIKDKYSAGDFEKEVNEKLIELYTNLDVVVLAGGSGLFIKAAVEGFDDLPDIPITIRKKFKAILKEQGIEALQNMLKEKDAIYYEMVDLGNPQRLIRAMEIIDFTGKPYSSLLNKKKKERLYKTHYIGLNINRAILYERINQRVDLMMEKGQLEEAQSLLSFQNLNALQTVGYSELFSFLNNEISLEEAIILIKRNSRRYAKRQITWFKKIENITWFEPNTIDDIIEHINKVIIA